MRHYADFQKKAAMVASHYGFLPLQEVIRKNAKEAEVTLSVSGERAPDAVGRELVHVVRVCLGRNLCPPPKTLLIYHGTHAPERKEDNTAFGLEVVGTRDSLAEALVLRAALAILEELGTDNLYVRINSIGDRDSSARFLRELSLHIRKYLHLLPAQIQQLFKRDVFRVFDFIQKKRRELLENAPKPVEFLSAGSRRHLREVLEYLETANIAYELDPLLLGNRDCYSQTIFEIRERGGGEGATVENDEESMFARGGRYDEMSRRFFKTQLPGVGIIFRISGGRHAPPIVLPKRPRAFIISLGFDAKLRTLLLIDTLRQAHIPFFHSLSDGSFSDQIRRAEALSIPYLLIVGQKEAHEGTVIVRNMETRAQDIISYDLLSKYVKEFPVRARG